MRVSLLGFEPVSVVLHSDNGDVIARFTARQELCGGVLALMVQATGSER